MNDMGIAFELLGVGMVTVFVILTLVVVLGDLIIRFVNHFIPVMEKDAPVKSEIAEKEINPKKMAAIVSAVSLLTDGTGRVKSIEKI